VRVAVPLLHGLSVDAVEALCSARAGNTSLINRSPEYGLVHTGLQAILETAIRTRTKASAVAQDLKEMNLPDESIALIVELLRRERGPLEAFSMTNRTRFPQMESLQWRVDVAISSSSLLRVFRPSILMQVRKFHPGKWAEGAREQASRLFKEP
jgi:hypothetical protein